MGGLTGGMLAATPAHKRLDVLYEIVFVNELDERTLTIAGRTFFLDLFFHPFYRCARRNTVSSRIISNDLRTYFLYLVYKFQVCSLGRSGF